MPLLNLQSLQARMLVMRTGLSSMEYTQAIETVLGFMIEDTLEENFVDHDSEGYTESVNLVDTELDRFFDEYSIDYIQSYFLQPNVWVGLLPQFKATVVNRVMDWSRRYSVAITIPGMEKTDA